MDYEAIFTCAYYITILGLFIFSLILFIKNIKKPKGEKKIFPFIFFIVMTILLIMTIAFLAFVLMVAHAMILNG